MNVGRNCVVLLWALSGLWPLRSAAFDAIYGFGDSLTDTGNNPAPAAGYYQRRYSNGPLWIEYLSTTLGLPYRPSNNYAVSGAQTADALNQVRQFTVPADATNALFVVWAGGNDFIDNFSQVLVSGLDNAFWNGVIAAGVSNLVAAVSTLQGEGARAVVVPNLVDLSKIPAAADLPPFVLTYFHDRAVQFNMSLAAALGAIQTAHPDLQLIEPDVFTQFNHVLANPGAYGFTRTTVDALSDPQLLDKSFSGPGAAYVFWDPIHPTTKAHALIGQWFYGLLPVEATPQLSVAIAAGALQITCANLQVGRLYTLQSSTNLATWNAATTFTATNAVQPQSVDLAPNAATFFRLKS